MGFWRFEFARSPGAVSVTFGGPVHTYRAVAFSSRNPVFAAIPGAPTVGSAVAVSVHLSKVERDNW